MALRYLTIDFNSFFASVEQQERPELRGRPVAIVPVLAETTGCIAVSLEAKQLGLKRGARIAEARLVCPGLQVVESRPETYINYHRRLIEVIESCIHVTKVQSIDEVTCELTARFAPRAEAVALAGRIKAKISREVGPLLRSSIGIAPNWLLAKVASDMQKPDGLVILDEEDIPTKLLHLEPGDISGIGSNIQQRLRGARHHHHGAALRRSDGPSCAAFGKACAANSCGGCCTARISLSSSSREGSTIGHGHVLPPESRNHEAALAVLHRLLQKAAMRLRHSGLCAGGLQVSVDYRDDTHWNGELRLTETQDTLELTRGAQPAVEKASRRRPQARAVPDRRAPRSPAGPAAAHARSL